MVVRVLPGAGGQIMAPINFSGPQFLYLYIGDNDSPLEIGLTELMYVKPGP